MPASPQQIAEKNAKLEQFAELLSLDISRQDIADRMGINPRLADKYLQTIRERLGPQAS